MRKLLIIWLALAALHLHGRAEEAPAATGSLAALDEGIGFFGIVLGQSLEGNRRFERTEVDPGLRTAYYTETHAARQLGDIPLTRIGHHAFRGRIFLIDLHGTMPAAADPARINRLKEILVRLYGKPGSIRSERDYLSTETSRWTGKRVSLELTVTRSPVSGTTFDVRMLDLALDAERQEFAKEHWKPDASGPVKRAR